MQMISTERPTAFRSLAFALIAAALLAQSGCGGGGDAPASSERSVATAGRMRAQAVASADALVTDPPARTITGILGYGTNLKGDGAFLAARGSSSFPLNNHGVVAINRVYSSYPEETGDGFLLTSDGITYTPVAAGGPAGQLIHDGFAFSDSKTLTFQRGPMGQGTPSTYQLFARAEPYSTLTTYSDICACYASELRTNANGQGVAISATTDFNVYSLIRFDGSGGSEILLTNLPNSPYLQGNTRPRILADGTVYVAVLNYLSQPQAHEIRRYPPAGEHTVAYTLPAINGAITSWGVNESGNLVVAEVGSTGANPVLKTVAANGVATEVAGSRLGEASRYLAVFVNQAGLIAAYRSQPSSDVDELLYFRPGAANPVRLFGKGDALNGGVVSNLMPTSEMNEAGQLTLFSQIDISPLPFPTQQLVVLVTPLFPSISTLAPTSGQVGSVVTINGKHLAGATSLAFNGTAATFTVVSDTEISATVPAGATNGPVSVTTPAGSATSSDNFTVTAPPAPVIATFSPTSGQVGAAVTITGVNFSGATSVTFNGTAASFTIVSDAQIDTTVPVGATTGVIVVTTLNGTATSAGSFTVTTLAAPVIASVSPGIGGIGSSVTIKGSNFSGATAVMFNGVAATFKLKGSGQISTTVPAGATTGPLVVTTAAGAASFDFVVVPAPQVGGFTPANGPPGTQVTISGANFVGVVSVTFGGAKAMTFSVVSDTSIVATVPNGAKSGPIGLVAAGGSAVSAAPFQVVK